MAPARRSAQPERSGLRSSRWLPAGLGILLLPKVAAELAPGVREGAPGNETLSDYLERRNAFLSEQESLASGGKLPLSDVEQRLDVWLGREVAGIITAHKAKRLSERFISASYFPAVRSLMENTTLFRLLRQMPKGGILHLHTGSSMSMDWVVDEGMLLPGCHVYWPRSGTGGNTSNGPHTEMGTVDFFNSTERIPAGFRPAQELLREEPDFRSRLLQLLTVHAKDEGLTSAQIWPRFQVIFTRLARFITHRPAFEASCRRTMLDLVADGVSYMELRVPLSIGCELTELDGRRRPCAPDMIDVFEAVLREVQQVAPDFEARLISTTVRLRSPRDIAQDLEYAVRAKAQRPHMVVGWDTDAEEDPHHTTLDYAAQLLKLPQLEARYGVQLPLLLHDGESDWPNNLNVVDAVLLGAKRIGHGFNLFNFPLLKLELIKRGVAVEVCPISNQVLRYIDDLRLHPGAQLLREGVPMVLSPDDPGIWGAVGLTHDFWAATVAWQLGVRSLKYLAWSSLAHSGLSSSERIQATQNLERQWHRFLRDWDAMYGAEAPRHIAEEVVV